MDESYVNTKTSIEEKSIPTQKVLQTIQQDDRTIKIIVGQQIIIEKENEEWLQVYVPYDKKGWIEVVKDIPGRKWNVENKYWLVPYVQDSLKPVSYTHLTLPTILRV